MKTKFCAGFVLLCVLSAFNAVEATAAPVQPATATTEAKSVGGAKKAPVKIRKPMASKSTSAHEIAQKRLPAANLDLRLPPELVKQLRPLGAMPISASKPLLPNMFGEKPAEESPFQLNGRLLSNEMNLQLRNDARHNEIEGAALDFEFKQ